jgi:hypothetical protein
VKLNHRLSFAHHIHFIGINSLLAKTKLHIPQAIFRVAHNLMPDDQTKSRLAIARTKNTAAIRSRVSALGSLYQITDFHLSPQESTPAEGKYYPSLKRANDATVV